MKSPKFTLSATPSIESVRVTGGEGGDADGDVVLDKGSQAGIEWTTRGAVDLVDIILRRYRGSNNRDDGVIVAVIASLAPNSGSMTWTPPLASSSDYVLPPGTWVLRSVPFS